MENHAVEIFADPFQNDQYVVQVKEHETNKTIREYEEVFETSIEAEQFVRENVEKEYNIVRWNVI